MLKRLSRIPISMVQSFQFVSHLAGILLSNIQRLGPDTPIQNRSHGYQKVDPRNIILETACSHLNSLALCSKFQHTIHEILV
jgi:hypothetical protein